VPRIARGPTNDPHDNQQCAARVISRKGDLSRSALEFDSILSFFFLSFFPSFFRFKGPIGPIEKSTKVRIVNV